jgi:N-acetylneuraminate epimerase
LYYFPNTDSWEFAGRQQRIPARVTLPVVYWQNQWFYISGEVKPGIRTPAITGVY